MTITEEQAAYAAGLFDGEGCVGFQGRGDKGGWFKMTTANSMGPGGVEFLRRILPHLVIKRTEVELALQFYYVRDGRRGPMTDEEHAQRSMILEQFNSVTGRRY